MFYGGNDVYTLFFCDERNDGDNDEWRDVTSSCRSFCTEGFLLRAFSVAASRHNVDICSSWSPLLSKLSLSLTF